MAQSGKTVLIVDDNAAGRELVRATLEREGYAIMEAVDGEDALVKAGEQSVDLALIDIQMPKMDGYTLARTMRADPRFAFLPLVAVTASAMDVDKQKAFDSGFTSYIPKPVRLACLRDEVKKLLK